MDTVSIARVCHEVNRAFCRSLGDISQPHWEEAPEWQRESALEGVKMHLADPDPDACAATSHESWMAHKIDSGWSYGPVKDEERRQHPCLVPFDRLPVHQQSKDFIFRAIVHAISTSSRAVHEADCALHNEPAYAAQPCDCGALP